MRTFGKWLGRVLLLVVVLAVAGGVWKREEVSRLMAVNTLFEEDRIVDNFSNMDRAFLSIPMPRGEGEPSPLPEGPRMELPTGVEGWIDARAVTSLLVLKDGQIAFEDYYLGTGADDLRIGWSVSKSYLAALMGIVVAEGAIASLDDQVTKYAPALSGAAYDGVTIRQVLTMTSGILFDEDYFDYNSDINRMGRVLALGGKMDDFAASIAERFEEPGVDWQYTSIDTHVLGMVIRGATGRSITDLMSEKIIAPLATEHVPYYVTDGVGVAFALGGINVSTRDYARFGQMILQGGLWQGRQIVPRDWVVASTSPQAPTLPGELHYGYQWWMPQDMRPREYMGRGIYGQYLYINEPQGVIVVATAADRKFRDDGVDAENTAIFRQIADALD